MNTRFRQNANVDLAKNRSTKKSILKKIIQKLTSKKLRQILGTVAITSLILVKMGGGGGA
ncbi:MAG: hypothetical protein LBJ00_02940 [Planctomycetaceae bacterium]|nr:hypothetical protein [Planctomycetaceae bacterium]